MACPCCLAMTAGELANMSQLPEYPAYMACHFSATGLGITDIPRQLPDRTVIMLDDSAPIVSHDCGYVVSQLENLIGSVRSCQVLLDFQRPITDAGIRFVQVIVKSLPCPVCVSHLYQDYVNSPILVPPLPPDQSPQHFYQKWKGRELWAELSSEAVTLNLNNRGCHRQAIPSSANDGKTFYDDRLFSHCRQVIFQDHAEFTFRRTWDDWQQLLQNAESLGITQAIGLYQEFRK